MSERNLMSLQYSSLKDYNSELYEKDITEDFDVVNKITESQNRSSYCNTFIQFIYNVGSLFHTFLKYY